MMLETMMHEYSSFITLTYSDENLPHDMSLDPKTLKMWLDRLRKRFPPRAIRWFCVGEYGDKTLRPHYHAAIFGLKPCQSLHHVKGECPCPSCSLVRETWGFGHVMVGTLTVQSARYITGYIAKKMARPDDPRLMGRYPEFARMTLKPGIGANAVPDVASVMLQKKLFDRLQLDKGGDVPVALRHGSSELPLGRYLRRLLRAQVGLPENAPAGVLEALRQGLLPVYETVEASFPHAKGELKRLLIAEEVRKSNEQYGRNTVARMKQKRKL